MNKNNPKNSIEWQRHMAYHCEENSHALNDWECDFIESIKNRLFNDKPLTDNQLEILERIYNEKVI